MPRAAKPTGKGRHDPLLVQLREDEVDAKYGRVSQPGRRKKARTSDADEDAAAAAAADGAVLDPKTSRKIFELARDQQVELGVLDDDADADDDDDDAFARPRIAADGDAEEEEEEELEVEEYEIDAENEFVSGPALRRELGIHLSASPANRRG
jgi:essential nuclear protein 1